MPDLENPSPAARGGTRIRAFDSVRGVAAFAVVIHHWADLLPPTPIGVQAFLRDPGRTLVSAIRFLQLGTPSVMIFFVLSGLVLSVSIDDQRDTYGKFVLKRVFRIYPSFIFAILLSAVLYLVARPQPIPNLSYWFNQLSWMDSPSLMLIMGHLILPATLHYQGLDNVAWTLAHEIRVSFVFPLINACAKRASWFSFVGFPVLSLAALGATRWISAYPATWLMTAHYSLLFFIGSLFACHRVWVTNMLLAIPGWQRTMLWAACLFCLLVPAKLFSFHIYLTFAGACGIVALTMSDRLVTSILEHKLPLYLGKISYSLYLVHVPILLLCVHTLYGHMPIWTVAVVGIFASLVGAHLINRLVERPSQGLGRRIAVRL